MIAVRLRCCQYTDEDSEMLSPLEALLSDAADSEIHVVSYSQEALLLRVTVDCLDGRVAEVQIPRPVHADIPPNAMLEKMTISDVALLPDGYLASRYKGNEGDEQSLCVTEFCDQDDNVFFVLSYQRPEAKWA